MAQHHLPIYPVRLLASALALDNTKEMAAYWAWLNRRDSGFYTFTGHKED